MVFGRVDRVTLVKKGYEVLQNVETASLEGKRVAAEVATAYARLAEAIEDRGFHGEV